jgi:lysosomal acid lipase/cholesteryl ester hydrolase
MKKLNLKGLITGPYNFSVKSLNYLQDRISSQKPTETFENVKIREELKEEKMSFEELVISRGHPLEIHYAETEDGYVLKLYRIPGGKEEKSYKNKQKQSILLMHGIFDSSDGWVCNSEDKCIPFILANRGFDVWLGNNRGNKHSRFHKTYSTDSFEFWNFSFHEMGLYDLPAFINHIIQINTFSDKIVYIGHSQGTAQLFAALTQNLEFFETKIKLAIMLGPVASVCNINSQLLILMHTLKIDKLFQILAFNEILCSDEGLDKVSSWIMPKVPSFCNFLSSVICDTNPGKSNNMKMMPVYLSHQPGGSSLKSINHFVQMVRSKKFEMYDYGEKSNLEIYNSKLPPEYDLNHVHNIPIGLFSGNEDKLAGPKDVDWLKDQLGENVVYFKSFPGMGHMTFMMSNDITWFNDALELIDMYL